jgi:hypothetical protein
MTQQEKLIRGLLALGRFEVKRTHRYVIFTRREGGFYYVGKNGALRSGNNVTDSLPCSTHIKLKIMECGK